MNRKAMDMEYKLELALLHKRFVSIEDIERDASFVLNKEVKFEESTNEDDLNLDYELLCGLELKDNYYYINIYYLKTRCDEMYITEISVDNE